MFHIVKETRMRAPLSCLRRITPLLLFCLVLSLFPLPARAQRGVQVNTDPTTGEDIPGDAANQGD